MFSGYLIKAGNAIIPGEYIIASTFKSKPNQRIELNAYRDANALLHRDTSKNMKSIVSFETPAMTEEKVRKLLNLFQKAFVEEIERKLEITYWNIEEGNYKKAVVYMPDIEFTICRYDDSKIEYESFTCQFIEY